MMGFDVRTAYVPELSQIVAEEALGDSGEIVVIPGPVQRACA
jgi:hypothetical protein